MDKQNHLLHRLSAIGEQLAKRDSALALIGLGSVGVERERLDDFSDLDFFVIVEEGHKERYLADLSWLTEIAPVAAPVAYAFMNTPDGYKLLYMDGVFCEFAVFEEAELAHIPFTAGRVVWRAEGVDEGIAVPRLAGPKQEAGRTDEWLMGEALTNLYVGLLREQRGERLSALRFIQGYAVDRILELVERRLEGSGAARDPFNVERRFEQRFPQVAAQLPALMQGYERNRDSARAAIAFLEVYFEVDEAMKAEVLALC